MSVVEPAVNAELIEEEGRHVLHRRMHHRGSVGDSRRDVRWWGIRKNSSRGRKRNGAVVIEGTILDITRSHILRRCQVFSCVFCSPMV